MASSLQSTAPDYADALTAAWFEFDEDTKMPAWFPDTAETLQMLADGFTVPDSYFVFDVETVGGFDFHKALITEIGWGVVVDRQMANSEGLILDWTRHPGIDQAWLRNAVDETRRAMEEKGREFHFSYERLRDEGVPPLEALHTYSTLLYEYITRDELIVAHNGWRFDRGMVNGHMWRFFHGYKLPWRANSIFDTGLCEKAMQMNRPPYRDETLDEWFKRINAARIRGITWNLDQHCMTKYRLAERYHLDTSQSHQAGFDCLVTHYLMETFRSLMEVLTGCSGSPSPTAGQSTSSPRN